MQIETVLRPLAVPLSVGVLTLGALSCDANRPNSGGAVEQINTDNDARAPNESGADNDASLDAGDDATTVESEAAAAADSEAVDETGTESETPATSPQSLVRLANWTPDAPGAGFDVCLAPHGTTTWGEPLLMQTFAHGTLGQGGPNGIQFPWVTQAIAVPPGAYDLPVIVAGSADCTTGQTPTPVVLPELVAGARTLIATIGDLQPTDNDASFKVAVFPDALPAAGANAALRVINTLPAVGYVDVGTGSAASHDFSPLFTDVAFGTSGMNWVDAGVVAPGGYGAISPISNTLFSARASGVAQDTATASHVTLGGGTATTMTLVNGENGGVPPQFLVCVDTAKPVDSLTPCMVFAQ